MRSHSPTPAAGTGRAGRDPLARSGGMPSMSLREIEAYLLARDAMRRIRRTAGLSERSPLSPRARPPTRPPAPELTPPSPGTAPT